MIRTSKVLIPKPVKLKQKRGCMDQHSSIKQFANDTTLTLKDEQDIKIAVMDEEKFENFSGITLNKRKSEGTWIPLPPKKKKIKSGRLITSR